MKKIENLFVSYEIAKQLKEKGFNELCLAYHHSHHGFTLWDAPSDNGEGYYMKNSEFTNGGLAYPLYQQAIDFIYEKYKIAILYSPQKDILEIDILRAIESIKNK